MRSMRREFFQRILIGLFVVWPELSARAETFIFHASQSGKQTLDQGEGGGNPFASALIELLQRPSLSLQELPLALRQATERKSRGFQTPDGPTTLHGKNRTLVPNINSERRMALVLVVSDYRQSGGAQSLPGASHDATRVASALRQAGFDTEIALDLGLDAMRAKLSEFGHSSRNSDAAILYVTGHGMEVGGTVFLLPSDYPVKQRNAALAERALAIPDIALSLQAQNLNLVFYAGCRDNPFGS